MSSESVLFYSEVASYFGKYGNITAWNSAEWGTKIRDESFDDSIEFLQNPLNAVKCAAEKGKCKNITDIYENFEPEREEI